MLQDPFGYAWSVSTVTEEMPVEEMHRRMKGLTTGPEADDFRGDTRESGFARLPQGDRLRCHGRW